jgi:hypothetical protein
MFLAYVWLISSIGHVYVEPELEEPTERVQVDDFTNLVDSRQAPVHLTNALVFKFKSFALCYIMLVH